MIERSYGATKGQAGGGGRKSRPLNQRPLSTSGLDYYQPLAILQDFHSCRAKWRIITGSNRSGKTLAGAIELSRAVLGRDPEHKYRREHGVAIVIGLDTSHIGMLWRKLSIPGAFKLIPDGDGYRSVRPAYPGAPDVHPDDLARIEEWIDAPPLIPETRIAKVSWYERTRKIPSRVELDNGWCIMFMTSRGVVKQGEHYDLVWIDEQINNDQFFYEADRGLVDVDPQWKALGIWTASPQKQNPLLWELCQKAATSTDIAVYRLHVADNCYVDKQSLEGFSERLTEDERAVRIDGEFAVDRWRIYPTFDITGKHGVDPFNVPEDWTIYIGLDPGTTNCATVIAAVPPEEKNVYIVGEVLVRNSDAYVWASELASNPLVHRSEAWIIDTMAGRQKGIGYSLTVAKQYFEAAEAIGIRPRVVGPLAGFIAGCAVPEVRIETVRRYLAATDDPNALHYGLKLFRGRTTMLAHQMRIAQFDEKNIKKRIRGEFDLLDAMEYLLAYNPRPVVTVKDIVESSDKVYQAFLRKRIERSRTRLDFCGVSLG